MSARATGEAHPSKRRSFTPRSEAIAFQVWAVAKPLGWNIALEEVADQIGRTADEVRGAVRRKGWGGRFRASRSEIKRSASLDGWASAKEIENGDLIGMDVGDDDGDE